MASKKRRFEQLQAAAANAPAESKKYVDPFQQQVVPKIEEVGKKLEGKGRTILYGLGAAIVLVILVVFVMRWSRSSSGEAQRALGKAIETSQSRVTDTPPAPGAVADKTFKTEKERAEASIAEFQSVADKFGGAVGDKAKYFIAVNRLTLDRAAGITELEAMASTSTEIGKMAKFAIAQAKGDDNKLDEAAAIYRELMALGDPIIAKETLNFNLAKILEKQDKKTEAADIYFQIAKDAGEAKDLDGKAVPLTDTAREAKEKLKTLDPERAKQIPESTPDSPFGGGAPPVSFQ